MQQTIRFSALDIHFADFICRLDKRPSNSLWWGAALASRSAAEGHSCFCLNDPIDMTDLSSQGRELLTPAEIENWGSLLLDCECVGRPGGVTPLLLDEAGRLYLHRCWSHEQKIAEGILSRSAPVIAKNPRLNSLLDLYFPLSADDGQQRSAAIVAVTRRFSVVSGGPGTGKTATVARILALLLELGEDQPLDIVLAAPTGKAALRLRSSIRSSFEKLPLPERLKKRLPTEVTTIHRLLGAGRRSGEFRQNRRNPLSCDILIIDEASMVDLQLMAGIFSALPDEAQIILLGDKNQLASVEAGAVLADICAAASESVVPVTNLTKSFRFHEKSGIAALSHLVNKGDSEGGVALLKSGAFPDVVWRDLPSGRDFQAAFTESARDGYRDFYQSATPTEAIARTSDFKVLTPLRSGEYGVTNLNRLCRNAFMPQKTAGSQSLFRQLLILSNNYELGLFNGDTGIAMTYNGMDMVWFEDNDGGLRHFAPFRMPPNEDAFALTVHKSQGSEFDRVLLLMPDFIPGLLCRELLYTAITRARCRIEIWGSEAVFRQTVEQRTVRKSGLVDRLASDFQE